jgi:putative ABC transport system permease protein
VVTRPDPSASPGDVQRRVERALQSAGLEVAVSKRIATTRVALEDHFFMVSGLLLAMAALIVAVGGLGLATTMSLAVMERISVPMSRLLTEAFGLIMFQAPFVLVPAPGAMVGWLAVVSIVAAIATLYPARTATTIITADALAYE